MTIEKIVDFHEPSRDVYNAWSTGVFASPSSGFYSGQFKSASGYPSETQNTSELAISTIDTDKITIQEYSNMYDIYVETAKSSRVVSAGTSYTFNTKDFRYAHIVASSKARSTKVRIVITQKVPPQPPSSISVPSSIRVGDKFTVSWGTGSGATKYYLYRSVNGGSYTQIYSGSSRSYSDTALASWDTVSYRVRSYNKDGYSSYRTSATRTIQHFPEFQMRVNGSLKTSDNGWVKVNGVLKEIDSIWVRVSGTLKEV